MRKPKRFWALACGLLLTASGLALAGPRTVEIERRGGDEQSLSCWKPTARLALSYHAKGSDLLSGPAAVETGEPQRRNALVPRALNTVDGAVHLRYWVLELRSFFSLLP